MALLEPMHMNELIREEQEGKFAEPRDLARSVVERSWLTTYQVEQILKGHAADLMLANYVLLDRLGQGAIGQVYKARHMRMDRLAAIKIIRPELLSQPEVVERFYREVEAAGRLSHPNIVAAYDAGPAGRTHFFAMEYAEGTDLDRLVKQSGPLPVEQAWEYIRQAGLGLQHAHERGLVHRDIKPANPLLRMPNCGFGIEGSSAESAIRNPQSAIVKIVDLGLARVYQAMSESRWGRGLTAEGTILGTPDFMAPEQVDNPHQIDAR